MYNSSLLHTCIYPLSDNMGHGMRERSMFLKKPYVQTLLLICYRTERKINGVSLADTDLRPWQYMNADKICSVMKI